MVAQIVDEQIPAAGEKLQQKFTQENKKLVDSMMEIKGDVLGQIEFYNQRMIDFEQQIDVV